MKDVTEYLRQRSEELMVFKMPRNQTLMDEIFQFDPRNLESLPPSKLSEYAIGLAQFLIYFQSQINASKVKLIQKNRVIDIYVNKSDIKGGTKAERRQKVIDNNHELQDISKEIECLEAELKMTENLERYYTELINAFKRELSRRDTEMRFTRDERRI